MREKIWRHHSFSLAAGLSRKRFARECMKSENLPGKDPRRKSMEQGIAA